ncbi:MAG: PP0621 family protein [Sideroxyarcus sp.]
MSRLLFLLAVLAVVYLLIRSFRRPAPRQDASAAPVEEMVRCAKCGVHLPKSESILAGGNYYCSDAHRREHTSK